QEGPSTQVSAAAFKVVRAIITGIAFGLFSLQAQASAEPEVAPIPKLQAADEYFLTASPYSYHFSHSPEHRDVWLVGIERLRNRKEVAGIAFFSNSFGQPSTFIYPWGRVYSGLIRQAPKWYVKWAAGLLYGYRDPYEDKVPLNTNGFSPGLIVAVGRPITETMNVQFNLLGNSAIMIQATFKLPPF
ncbi:MAG: hypothetical protein RLZZ344_264, partial [Pseudomonadota bacterium]